MTKYPFRSYAADIDGKGEIMNEQLSVNDLSPTHPMIRKATIDRLSPQSSPDQIEEYLSKMAASAASPIGATAGLNIAVWGKATCAPDGQPWKWDTTVWGGPVYLGSAVGFMYTAYDTWDAFFANVSSIHCQAIDAGGGILQFNWFIPNATPVGQFNGVAGGVGVCEAGGAGKWSRT